MTNFSSNQKIGIVAVISIVLLFFAFKPANIQISADDQSVVINENIAEDFDCNKCKSLVESKITIANPDSSKTYAVWNQGIFEGEFTSNTEFIGVCSNQLLVCYTDNALDDMTCVKGYRIEGKFACNEQLIKVK